MPAQSAQPAGTNVGNLKVETSGPLTLSWTDLLSKPQLNLRPLRVILLILLLCSQRIKFLAAACCGALSLSSSVCSAKLERGVSVSGAACQHPLQTAVLHSSAAMTLLAWCCTNHSAHDPPQPPGPGQPSSPREPA